MYRFSFLLVAGLTAAVALVSCSPIGRTVNSGHSERGAFLENLGNGICQQHPSGLMWQIKVSEKFSTLAEAKQYADNLQLGGFDDWRLPTRDECLYLAELLLIDKTGCPLDMRRAHWIQDPEGAGQSGRWEDYPMCGGPEFRWTQGKKGSVRAVRP